MLNAMAFTLENKTNTSRVDVWSIKKKNSPVASIKKRINDYSGSYREHNGINDRAIFILTESNLSIFFPDNLIDVMINDTASQFAFFHIESNKPNNRHQTAAKFYIHTGDDLAL